MQFLRFCWIELLAEIVRNIQVVVCHHVTFDLNGTFFYLEKEFVCSNQAPNTITFDPRLNLSLSTSRHKLNYSTSSKFTPFCELSYLSDKYFLDLKQSKSVQRFPLGIRCYTYHLNLWMWKSNFFLIEAKFLTHPRLLYFLKLLYF